MNQILSYCWGRCKSIGGIMLAVAALLEVVALVLYMQFGTSEFVLNLSSNTIGCMVAAIVVSVVVIFSPVKLPYVVAYVLHLFACFEYLASQASFIANVFVGIDGTSFPFAFYAIVVCSLAGAVLSLVAMKFVVEPKKQGGIA